MAKSENQKLKLLYLKDLFLEKTDEEHGITIDEIEKYLAEREIKSERKALYSDIRALRTYGIDVDKKKTKGVTYHVLSRDFELAELKLLVDAVQSSKFITHKKSTRLIKKIESLTSVHEARQLHRQVYVTNRIKTMNESIYYIVDEINQAINTNKQISFQYFEWNYKKEKIVRHNGERYRISPWALTWDDENYYLIGFDSSVQKIKHFRVDKILKMEIEDEKRDGAKAFEDFDAAVYSKKVFDMFSGNEENVVLRCKKNYAGIIIDRFGTDVNMIEDGEEHFTVSVRVMASRHFLGWIANLTDGIEVISPASVRADMANLARELLAQYE